MRIIIDNGAYTLRNMGDVAMLQTTVRRLRSLLDNPELLVLTTNPDLLRRYCPGTVALSVESRDSAYQPARPFQSDWSETWVRFKTRWGRARGKARAFQSALQGATAVLLAGGGFLNDLNPHQTRPVLRMLADAASRGKSTALLSQGLGPLDSPELSALLRRACQAGAVVALRENVRGPHILQRARAEPRLLSITGDDAVEIAWARGAARDGTALGVSLRQVGYSAIEGCHLEVLEEVVTRLAKTCNARIFALPVSFNGHERDDEVIARVVGAAVPLVSMDSPEALIHSVAQCRVVLTGTYHAAVFALAQGIPCACFYASPYYHHKLEGLAAQFPGGCELVDLRSNEAGSILETAALRLWHNRNPALSDSLRKAAQDQVRRGWNFYRAMLSSLPGFTGGFGAEGRENGEQARATAAPRLRAREQQCLHETKGPAPPSPVRQERTRFLPDNRTAPG